MFLVNNGLNQIPDPYGDSLAEPSCGPAINIPDEKIDLQNVARLIQSPFMK
jgi:hypothetical protein